MDMWIIIIFVVIIVVIGLYFLIAYFAGLPPFSKEEEEPKPSAPEEPESESESEPEPPAEITFTVTEDRFYEYIAPPFGFTISPDLLPSNYGITQSIEECQKVCENTANCKNFGAYPAESGGYSCYYSNVEQNYLYHPGAFFGVKN